MQAREQLLDFCREALKHGLQLIRDGKMSSVNKYVLVRLQQQLSSLRQLSFEVSTLAPGLPREKDPAVPLMEAIVATTNNLKLLGGLAALTKVTSQPTPKFYRARDKEMAQQLIVKAEEVLATGKSTKDSYYEECLQKYTQALAKPASLEELEDAMQANLESTSD
jgi:hypothetical protein